MKALVTGASGFTGSHLVTALWQRGDSVIAYVRRSSNLGRLEGFSGDIAYGDITDLEALTTAMADVDVVFHIAAKVDLGIVDEAEMHRVNVDGTRAVLAAIARQPTPPKLLYCSTIGIYGDTQGETIDETFQRQQQGFSSAYDRTKFEAQQLVDEAVQSGLHAMSIMPSGIMGFGDPHFGPVIQLFLSGWLKLWPGGHRITGIVHVSDVVDAAIRAVERANAGEHFILSAGDLSTRQMFEILGEATGTPVPAEAPPLLVRAIAMCLDPIGQVTSWNPPLSNERIHYIYDRCVRVDASKARQQLDWRPQSPQQLLLGILKRLQAANSSAA